MTTIAARPEPGDEPGYVRRQGHDDHRDREQGDRALQRPIAEDELEELHTDEEEPERRDELQQEHERAGPEVADEEQARIEHGSFDMQFPRDERGQGQRGDRERAESHRCGPSLLGSLDDPEHEGADPSQRSQRSERVEVGVGLVGGVRRDDRADDERDRGERGGDDERRTPPELLEQHARRDHAEDAARAREPRPQADGAGALFCGEDGGDRGERGGHDHRRADAHQRAEADEYRHRLRGGREGGGGAEDRRPDQQDGAAPEAVAQRAEGQDEGGERDRVRVRDPREVVAGRPEADGEIGERDVEARHRRHDQDQRQAHPPEDGPPSPARQWWNRLRDLVSHIHETKCLRGRLSSQRVSYDGCVTVLASTGGDLSSARAPDDPRVVRTREAVLKAAAELLGEEGPEAVSHQRVAERAGVGRATVYRHWPRPQDLLFDALTSVEVDFVELDDGPFHERLAAELIRRCDHLNQPIVTVVFAAVIERAESDESASRVRALIVEKATASLRRGIDGAVARGELAAGVNPDDLAAQVVGPLLYRRVFEGRMVDAPFITRVVDDALRPWESG